ncbi:MAG TPA: hypothetical protein VIY69_18200 [Candidatus Acidoferrales bacterium]
MLLTKSSFLGVLSLLAAPVILAAPAQTSAASCSVTIADHATIGRAGAVAGTDVFSGELLRTADEGRLMIQCGTVRLALASNSSMRVFQYGAKTSIELERGIVAYSTAGRSEDLALYGLDVKIVPNTSQPAIGQVDVSSACELSVESTKGTATVISDKRSKVVEENKAYEVTPKLGVEYSDDWHPVPADYPDFPHDAKYHDSHHHIACAAAPIQNAGTKVAMTNPDIFRAIVAGGVLAGAGYALWGHESESPYKP